MKELELVRSYLPDRTLGRLIGCGVDLCTLERPWLRNARNVSCIPESTYRVNRDNMGRYQYYRFKYVPDRTAIEMHGGRTPSHSDGCILVGEKFTRSYDLEGSKDALEDLLSTLYEQDFTLTIRAFDAEKDHALIRP